MSTPDTLGGRPSSPIPADHAFRLPGGNWQVWRDFVLRGTGFPVSLVLALNSDVASGAADASIAARREVTRRQEAALKNIRQAGEQAARGGDRAALPMLRKKRRLVLSGKVALGAGEDDEAALARAVEARNRVDAAYAEIFGSETASVEQRIEQIALEPRFREATLWQNHRAAYLVGRSLIRGGRHRQRREALDLIAMQLQRYAVKNDSIGFFGPVGWARLSERAMTVEFKPGPALIDRREVYFEGWCIDALAERLNELPGIRTWIAPRIRTGVWADARYVYAPGVGVVPVTPAQRRILDLCDGLKTVHELSRAVSDPSDCASGPDVIGVLEELLQLQLISWHLEVPSQLYPERDLQSRIEQIGEPTIRQTCATALTKLVNARTKVACSAGDVGKLERSLNDLDATFTRLTGRPAVRRAGEMYAARGLVYEDCRRDCALTLGRSFLDRIGPTLSVVLDGVRWTASEIATAVRHHLRCRHAELRAVHGASVLDSLLFYNEVRQTVPEAVSRLRDELEPRLARAWQEILDADVTASRLVRSIHEVRPRAEAMFRTVGRLWGHAQYISPDVMVAAASVDAFRQGDFHAVLGEVHTTSSVLRSCLVTQHPNRSALLNALLCDSADRIVVHRQRPKDSWLARVVQGVHSPEHWQYQYLDELPNLTDCRPAPAAMCLAVDNGETVVLRSRDGQLEFDALELFGMLLSIETDQTTKRVWLRSSHGPRVTIGDLTIARERWLVRPDEMSFLHEPDRARQFTAVRAWAQRNHMPSRVFYKSPAEKKPCYLDFNSPTYIALFTKIIRRLAGDTPLCIEEMFPDIGDVWLTDREGSRYTCEFRIAASVMPSAERARGGCGA